MVDIKVGYDYSHHDPIDEAVSGKMILLTRQRINQNLSALSAEQVDSMMTAAEGTNGTQPDGSNCYGQAKDIAQPCH